MTQQRPLHKEHPDIPKTGLNRLSKEIEYVRTQYLRTRAALDEAMRKIYMGITPEYPVWMYQYDLNYYIERYTAICEEIRFRTESMR